MKKILLACNAGMSTSLLVQKMKKEAQGRGLEIEISALPLAEAQEHVLEVDAFLLGPQISYARGDVEEAADGKVPVAVIPMVDYGRMNASKILDRALEMMGE